MVVPAPFDYELVKAPQQPARGLVVFFHGHGGNAQEFVTDMKFMQETLPDTDFICVNGPVAIDGNPYSRTWADLGGIGSLARLSLQLVFNRLPLLQELGSFIDSELKERGLDNRNLALMGFSFGGGVALTLAMARKAPCAAVISHSGVFYRYPHARSRPDALVIMGDADSLYTAPPAPGGLRGAFDRALGFSHAHTVRRLRKAGLAFEEHIVPGLDHTVNAQSLRLSADFLARRLAPPPTAGP